MKKILTALALASACFSPVLAAPQGRLAVGVSVGTPFGPTLKYWMDPVHAIDAGIGFEDNPIFYADYLWHNWDLISPQPSGAQIGLYAGLGPRFRIIEHDDEDEFGIRVPFGVSCLFNKAPIELFGEVVPVFQFSPDTDTEIDGGVGIRFLFGG